jgi:hypothetical protein
MRNCAHCGTVVHHRQKHCDDCSYTKSPWRVDDAALEKACDVLGIVLPVIVLQVADRDDPIGLYHAPRKDDSGELFHPITIVARLTPEAASRSIWHEITHAAQWEDDPDFVETYNLMNESAKSVAEKEGVDYKEVYRLIPYEVEAKANERYHESMFSLTRINKRASMKKISNHHRIVSVNKGVIVRGYAADEIEQRNRRRIETAERMLNR